MWHGFASKPCFSFLDPRIMDGLLVPIPWHHALSVCFLEDIFQNDPLDKDLHRKLRGEMHCQIIMIYLWNYHSVVCTLVFKKVFFWCYPNSKMVKCFISWKQNCYHEKCGVRWHPSPTCWRGVEVLPDSAPGKAALADCTFNPMISGTLKID